MNNEGKDNKLNSVFEIVKKIHSTAVSDFEEKFENVKMNFVGNYFIFINSETISNIEVFVRRKEIYRIEVKTNNIKLKEVELFFNKKYSVGFNLHDEETFFNFTLDKSKTLNAIHSGVLPSFINYSDEVINRIRFNFD
jgi:effector-binding domain-containing protein